jgi:hypothetical protein
MRKSKPAARIWVPAERSLLRGSGGPTDPAHLWNRCAADRVDRDETTAKKFNVIRLKKEFRSRCPEKTIWKVCRIKAANMAARRACRSLSQDRQQGLAMLPTKASNWMSVDRSSRGTKRALSKSAGRIRSDDDGECCSERDQMPPREVASSGASAPQRPRKPVPNLISRDRPLRCTKQDVNPIGRP